MASFASIKFGGGGWFSILLKLLLQFVIFSVCLIVASHVAAFCTLNNLDLGQFHSLNSEMPLQYDIDSLKFSIIISLPEDSLIRGNISLNKIHKTIECTTPAIPKTFAGIAFYSLNLTQLENKNRNQNGGLDISVESHVPTYFNLDPYSYWIFIYNVEENKCIDPEYYSKIGTRFTTTINTDQVNSFTFAVYAIKNLESAKFERSVSIHYPRSIIYMCNSDIKNVLYTFPKAAYAAPTLSPCMSVSRYYVPYSDLPESYSILARFQVSLFSQPLNITNARIDIDFKKTKYFLDIRNTLVEVLLESLTCFFLIEGNLYQLESIYHYETSTLTCFFQNGFNVNHDMFIAAKSTNSPINSAVVIPSFLEGNVAEKVILTKGASKVFSITIPRGNRLLLQLNFSGSTLLKDGLPIYLSTDFIPSNNHYSKKLISSGYYNNDENRPITCYILVENPLFDTCIVTLTPSLEFAEAEPGEHGNALTIIFAIMSAILCITLIPLLVALIIIIRRNIILKMELCEENKALAEYGSNRI